MEILRVSLRIMRLMFLMAGTRLIGMARGLLNDASRTKRGPSCVRIDWYDSINSICARHVTVILIGIKISQFVGRATREGRGSFSSGRHHAADPNTVDGGLLFYYAILSYMHEFKIALICSSIFSYFYPVSFSFYSSGIIAAGLFG